MDDLRGELEEAERFNDPSRAARLHMEIDFVSNELATAYGIGGRPRQHSQGAEQVRKAVTNRIREDLKRIKKAHLPLWRHLFASLQTGAFCSYRPEKPTTWQVQKG